MLNPQFNTTAAGWARCRVGREGNDRVQCQASVEMGLQVPKATCNIVSLVGWVVGKGLNRYINTAIYHEDWNYSTLLLLWIGFFHDSCGSIEVMRTPSNDKCQPRSSSILIVVQSCTINDMYINWSADWTAIHQKGVINDIFRTPGSRFDFHFAILCEVLCQQIRNFDWELMDLAG